MLLDTSFYGFKAAALRFMKVVLYVAISGAVAALVAYFANYEIDAANLYQVGLIALINGTLASASKWLGSVNPVSVKATVTEV